MTHHRSLLRKSRSHPAGFPDLTRRRSTRLFADETGAATAEYAIATMANVNEIERISVR